MSKLTTARRVDHTPGPWDVALAFGFPRIVQRESLISVADALLEGGKASGRQPEVAANARLIAAAPDLLAALEDLADACDGNYTELVEQARAAIAKARGEA